MEGLNKKQVIDYWDKRYAEQGERAPGYLGKDMSFQDILYNERARFFIGKVPLNLRTLDYGCGTGKYSHLFYHYVGVDISKKAIEIANLNTSYKKFILLKSPMAVKINFDPQMIFTATVLQHNDDKLVRGIIMSWFDCFNPEMFCIYEADGDESAPHCKSRKSESYCSIIAEFIPIKSVSTYSHYPHNFKHTLTIIRLWK